MKKICVFVTALILTLGFTLNVNAMSEDELKAKFETSYNIGGETLKLKDHEKVLVEEYLTNNKISSSDADYIAKKLDEVINIFKSANTVDYSKLSKSDKNKLVAIVNDISSNTAVKGTVLKGGVLVIKNIDGTEFARVTKDAIRQTGTANITFITGGISLAGLVALILILKKRNA